MLEFFGECSSKWLGEEHLEQDVLFQLFPWDAAGCVDLFPLGDEAARIQLSKGKLGIWLEFGWIMRKNTQWEWDRTKLEAGMGMRTLDKQGNAQDPN